MANDAWQQFLSAQSATVATQWPLNSPLATHARMYPSADDGLIAVSGADAVTFLQGQLTNDIKQVANQAQLTGYCTAKGRLLALFYAFSMHDIIYMQCPRALVPSLVKRLTMFVMRSKVTIQDVSDAFVSLGLSSTQSAVTEGWPTATNATLPIAGGQLIRLSAVGDVQRARLICPVDEAIAQWPTWLQTYTLSPAQAWEWLEVQAGTPQVYPATQEQFVPQMLNLDQLDGINFKKGCYTGQEIVARTHYLGKVKRRTGLASLTLLANDDTAALPQVGDKVFDQQQQEAGQIVRLAPALDGSQYDVLVEYRLEAKEAGEIYWQSQALNWLAMPYAIEN